MRRGWERAGDCVRHRLVGERLVGRGTRERASPRSAAAHHCDLCMGTISFSSGASGYSIVNLRTCSVCMTHYRLWDRSETSQLHIATLSSQQSFPTLTSPVRCSRQLLCPQESSLAAAAALVLLSTSTALSFHCSATMAWVNDSARGSTNPRSRSLARRCPSGLRRVCPLSPEVHTKRNNRECAPCHHTHRDGRTLWLY